MKKKCSKNIYLGPLLIAENVFVQLSKSAVLILYNK